MSHNKHTHEWNDKGGVYYTCPLQQKQECACGATRYIEISNSGIPTVKLTDEEFKQRILKKTHNKNN